MGCTSELSARAEKTRALALELDTSLIGKDWTWENVASKHVELLVRSPAGLPIRRTFDGLRLTDLIWIINVTNTAYAMDVHVFPVLSILYPGLQTVTHFSQQTTTWSDSSQNQVAESFTKATNVTGPAPLRETVRNV